MIKISSAFFQTKTFGFSLIEMAVVLVILGYLLSGLLPSLSTRYEASKINQAKSQLNEIKAALIGFTLANRRLPCPDIDSDGNEDQTAGDCTRAYGEPPWSDLSTQRYDPWNQQFTYRVTPVFAQNNTPNGLGCAPPPPTLTALLCTVEDITITSTNFGAGPATLNFVVPAILVSHGKPGGTSSAFELENLDNDINFRKEVYNNIIGNEFDDIVVWISANILVAQLVDAGQL